MANGRAYRDCVGANCRRELLDAYDVSKAGPSIGRVRAGSGNLRILTAAYCSRHGRSLGSQSDAQLRGSTYRDMVSAFVTRSDVVVLIRPVGLALNTPLFGAGSLPLEARLTR